MIGIAGSITAVKLNDGGHDDYTSIELTVRVPIPRLRANLPERPNFFGEKLSDWEKKRLADYEDQMTRYRKAEREWQCAFENAYSLCLEEISILPSRELKQVPP